MENKIYEAISGWASVSTWFTSHPLDERRFNDAIANLINTVGTNIQREDFEAALMRHASGTTPTLGSPSEWDEYVSDFTDKAMVIVEFESSRS